MDKHGFFVIQSQRVEPFWLPEDDGITQTQLLIDRMSAGSDNLILNRLVLRPGRRTAGGSIRCCDVAYYVLAGSGYVLLDSDQSTHRSAEIFELEPDTAVFLPAGTYHRLKSGPTADLVLLTIWPTRPPPEDEPRIYDARRKAWGTTLRLTPEASENPDPADRQSDSTRAQLEGDSA